MPPDIEHSSSPGEKFSWAKCPVSAGAIWNDGFHPKLRTRKQVLRKRRIRSKFTYANVVATLALFIALGGVSYAAVKLPKNSVGEKQLKKNAVTGKKIKKSTITADKIKNGTITGADINVGSLGKVPSAAVADSAGVAGSAANQINTAKRVGPSSNNATYSTARDQATEVPLGSNGQVSVYGKCFKSGTTLYAQTYSKTTADGALVSVYSDYFYGSPYLNVATTEDNREVYFLSTGTDTSYGFRNYYGIGSIFGPDGNGMNFHVQAWVKNGNPISGDGAYGPSDTCIWMFSGSKASAN